MRNRVHFILCINDIYDYSYFFLYHERYIIPFTIFPCSLLTLSHIFYITIKSIWNRNAQCPNPIISSLSTRNNTQCWTVCMIVICICFPQISNRLDSNKPRNSTLYREVDCLKISHRTIQQVLLNCCAEVTVLLDICNVQQNFIL